MTNEEIARVREEMFINSSNTGIWLEEPKISIIMLPGLLSIVHI
jgi:hypothetical protein